VSLTVSGLGGSDTNTKTDYITVYTPAAAEFSGTPLSGPHPLAVTFTDASTGDIDTWSWDFDNDGTEDATVQNPAFTYNTPGIYTVSLTASGLGGSDTNTKTDYITVYTAAVSDFSATPLSGPAALAVTFTDASTGDIDTWSWDFDNDGTEDSTEQNPAFTYNTPGVYTVTLTASGLGGSDTNTKTDYITVYSPAGTDFSATPTSGNAPLPVTFTDLSSGDIDTWSWDFDNDGTEDSTEQNPAFTYNTPGIYTVTLSVDGPGGSDSVTKTDYISVYTAALSDFSATPLTGIAPTVVTFTDASSGDIDTWSWDFDNDGTEDSTVQNPSYTYTAGNTYTVSLTVSGLGGSDTLTRTDYITIYDPAVASFTATPLSGLIPLAVTFTDGSTGDIDTWSWDFDNDGTEDSTVQNPSYTYTTQGTYTVSLTVSGNGGSDTQTRIDYIDAFGSVIPDFTATPTSGIAPLTVTFTDTSTGTINTWSWDFDNDGTADSTVQNPSYTYTVPGVYSVRLFVAGPGGGGSTTKPNYIDVYDPAVADFTGAPLTGIAPFAVTFTDASTGDIDTWSWDFDNDGTEDSTQQNPTYTYTSGGIYTVTLDVSGDGGIDTVTRTDYLTVYNPAAADFTGTPTSGPASLAVTFTDLSTGDIDIWSWDFDNDGTEDSTEQNPSYTFDTPGTYTVVLTASGLGGSDTSTKTDYITVYTSAAADFTATPTSGPAPLTATFTDLSLGDIDSWSWDFDNDGTEDSTEQDPGYTYTTPGIYTVSLTASGPGGSDTKTQMDYITVYTPALADFTATPTSGPASLAVTFTDSSSGDINTWSWDFDNDGTEDSAVQSPSYTYTIPGVYAVSLTVSGLGGSDTNTKVNYITVYTPPSADFAATPMSGPAPLALTFTDFSVGDVDAWSWDFDNDGTEDSTVQSPLYTYNNPGTYTVTLTASGLGGSDTTTKTDYVTVFVPATADFSGTPRTGPPPLAVSFSDASSGDVDTWSWDFDSDGTEDSTEQNPSYTFNLSRVYDVTLTASGPGGSDTKTEFAYIIVEPAFPTADFSATPPNGVGPLTVQFNDLSTGSVDTWSWDFDNDGTEDSTEQNPPYTYTATGTYSVSLAVSGPLGADATTKLGYISVGDAWYVNGNKAGDPPVSGDGTSWAEAFLTINEAISAASPSDGIFVAGSTYKERLVIDKQLTLTAFTYNQTIIRPTDTPQPGVYDIEIDASGTVIQDFVLDFNGPGGRSGNGIMISDLGEPAVTNVKILNNRIYAGEGNVTAIQTGTNSDVSGLVISGNVFYGDDDRTDEAVHVNPFTGAGTVRIENNEFYGFDSGVTIEAGSVQVTGNMINGQLDPDVQQPAPGALGIQFIDSVGGASFSNVLIENNRVEYTDYALHVGTTTDVGSSLSADIISNTLLNNFNGLWAEYGVNLTVAYNYIAGNSLFGVLNDSPVLLVAENNWWGDVSGPYHPTTNPSGLGNEVSDNVDYAPWLLESLPIAEFDSNLTLGDRPLLVQFADLSTGTVTDYDWDFGDGDTSTEQDPSHVYTETGDYTVRLTVTGPGGSTFRGKNDYIHVTEPAPVAAFSGTPTVGVEPLTVHFTDESTGMILAYYWDFDNDGTEDSTQENPQHVYQLPGDYSVKLTLAGPDHSDFEEKIGYIHVDYALPGADFTADHPRTPTGMDVQFADLSSGVITAWSWDLDNDGTEDSTEQNPVYQYAAPGYYTVALSVTGPGGTNATQKTNFIYVNDGPIADFSGSPLDDDSPLTVQFQDASLGSVTGYLWHFGDGQTSTEQNPTHDYFNSGDYTVTLDVSGSNPDSISKTGYVHVREPAPTADFTADVTTGIYPMTVQFTDQSLGWVNSYSWKFGDGHTSTEQHPTHVYQDNGLYKVRLTVTGPDYSDMMEKVDYIYVGRKKWWASAYANTVATPSHDEAHAVVNTLEGGYLVAGESDGDVWLLKLHADRSIVWEKTYGDTGSDAASAVQATMDGGYIVAGATDSFGAGALDVWILKVDSDGTIAWQKAYGTAADDQAHAIAQTFDGGYIVAGENNDDAWVLKLNSDGTIAWQKTYGDQSYVEKAHAVEQTSDSGYIVAGENNDDAWVLKLNSDGTIAWQKTYGDQSYVEKAHAVEQTSDSSYIVAGENSGNAWVFKLNSDGTVAWQKTYGNTGVDKLHAIFQTADGGYAAAGGTNSYGKGMEDVWIVRLNSDGTLAWQRTYGGTENDAAVAIQMTPDNEYVLAGYTESFGNGTPDSPNMWVLRVDAVGEVGDCIYLDAQGPPPIDTLLSPSDSNVLVADTTTTAADTTASPQDSAALKNAACIEDAAPVANFSVNPKEGKNPLTVQFTDLSTGIVTDYLWDFGDDTKASGPHPVHTYKGIGQYSVKLTVTGPLGEDKVNMVDDMDEYIDVTEGLPIADFTADHTVGTAPFTVRFDDNSKEKWGPINTYFWDFGDGHTAYGKLAYHQYMDSDEAFTVSLTATGPGGSNTKVKYNFIHRPDFYPLQPVIENINPNKPEPATKIVIVGYNFGKTQGDSVIHIGPKVYDASQKKVKSWSDTKIKVKLKNYDCDWFKGKRYRKVKVWVTVDGNDSLTYDAAGLLTDKIKKIRVYKPDTCP